MKTKYDDDNEKAAQYNSMEEYLEFRADKDEMVAFVNALRTHYVPGNDKGKKIIDLTAMEILEISKKEWIATRKSRHEFQEENIALKMKIKELERAHLKHDIVDAIMTVIQVGFIIGIICACIYGVYASFHLSYYKIDAVKELGHAGIGGLKEVVETIWGQ
jgi:hypothetical protein